MPTMAPRSITEKAAGRQVIAGAGHDVEIDDLATVIAAVRGVLLANGACP